MSFATQAAAIRSRFDTSWANATPVAWPNVNFDPSKVGGVPTAAEAPAPNAWLRFTILPATGRQMTLAPVGSRTFRNGGLIVIQVFTPEGTGDGSNQTLCENAAAIFRGVTDGGIRYAGPSGESPRIRTIGNADGYFQQNVEIPFSADTTA